MIFWHMWKYISEYGG